LSKDNGDKMFTKIWSVVFAWSC